MVTELNEMQRRVLGALIEKALTQPEYYPMTLNALVAACNQKSNRNPVMSLDEDVVLETLESLRDLELVALVLPAPGSRTNRYKHTADTHFGWQRREMAVITELLLRGPQTPGELRTRCSRMAPFESLESVSLVLDLLQQADPPRVAVMPREPAQSAVRYQHRLYPASEQPTPTLHAAASTGPRPAAPQVAVSSAAHARTSAVPGGSPSSPPVSGGSSALQDRIDTLQDEIAGLQQNLAELRSRLDQLESQLLH
jgi:uncharacterized protein YceH (UPF0502 family)